MRTFFSTTLELILYKDRKSTAPKYLTFDDILFDIIITYRHIRTFLIPRIVELYWDCWRTFPCVLMDFCVFSVHSHVVHILFMMFKTNKFVSFILLLFCQQIVTREIFWIIRYINHSHLLSFYCVWMSFYVLFSKCHNNCSNNRVSYPRQFPATAITKYLKHLGTKFIQEKHQRYIYIQHFI
jgi:hypothetical protein